MIECPHCDQTTGTPAGLKTHLRKAHGVVNASDTPDTGPGAVTVAFSDREWVAIERLAKRQNVTPAAVVRAMVQRVISTGPPAPRTPPPAPKAPEAHELPCAAAPTTATFRTCRSRHQRRRAAHLPRLPRRARQEEPARPRPVPEVLRGL